MSAEPVPRQEAATRNVGNVPAPVAGTGHTVGSLIADKYRLERLLGEGGMGSVWQAQNVHLDVLVAIKLLRAGLVPNNELVSRLRTEARAAARLVHPSIVRVFDIGETNTGDPFIVMELLAGESFGNRIYRKRPSSEQVVQLLLPIAEALHLAHSNGVVHRDLKPDNIFLSPEGEYTRPKLLDFGIAKVVDGAPMGHITQRGVLVGSPAYMSPEQARGDDNVDFRTDIWSFCVVLYEAVSNNALPFGTAEGAPLLRAIVQDAPIPLPNVDRGLWSIIEQGLSKEAEHRPVSMFELGRALATWLLERGVTQDAAGAGLDTKWIPRPHSTTTPRLELVAADPVTGEHGTFQPVTSGGAYAPTDFDAYVPRRRKRGPLLALALVATALGTGAAWYVKNDASESARAEASVAVDSSNAATAPALPPVPVAVQPHAEPERAAEVPKDERPADEKPAKEPSPTEAPAKDGSKLVWDYKPEPEAAPSAATEARAKETNDSPTAASLKSLAPAAAVPRTTAPARPRPAARRPAPTPTVVLPESPPDLMDPY